MLPSPRIYIVETGIDPIYSKKLKELFREYNVTLVKINTKSSKSKSSGEEKLQQTKGNSVETDNLTIKQILQDCKEQHPDDYCVILFDIVLSVVDDCDVKKVIDTAIKKNEDATLPFDVLYLFRYLDQCKTYVNKQEIQCTNFNLYKSDGSAGRYGLMFSILGRDRILGLTPMSNGMIFEYPSSSPVDFVIKRSSYESLLDTVVVVPSLFELNLEVSQDFEMTHQCEAPLTGDPSPTTSKFLLWIIFLLVVASCFVVFLKRKRHRNSANEKK